MQRLEFLLDIHRCRCFYTFILVANLADRDAGALGEHSGGDIHGREFLEEQLSRVWNMNLRDLGLVLAGTAFEGLGFDFARR
jgi:hypothetical protein